MFTRKSRPRLGKNLTDRAKRLLQQYRPGADIITGWPAAPQAPATIGPGTVSQGPIDVDDGHAGFDGEIHIKPMTASYCLRFADGPTIARARSMNSRATGLMVRFFKVTIPAGVEPMGNSIGKTLIGSRVMLKRRREPGYIAK